MHYTSYTLQSSSESCIADVQSNKYVSGEKAGIRIAQVCCSRSAAQQVPFSSEQFTSFIPYNSSVPDSIIVIGDWCRICASLMHAPDASPAVFFLRSVTSAEEQQFHREFGTSTANSLPLPSSPDDAEKASTSPPGKDMLAVFTCTKCGKASSQGRLAEKHLTCSI